MKIYMDVCCLNRPFDDQTQERVRIETEAVMTILSRCKTGIWDLAASDMIEKELEKSRNLEKLAKVKGLYRIAKNRCIVTKEVEERARVLQSGGIKTFDSLHLALAEIYHQDVFLTTDDAFLAAANKMRTATKVAEPVSWFMEVTQYDC